MRPEDLDKVIHVCFVQPQTALGSRDKTNRAKLDHVAVLAVRLDSDVPSTKSTMLFDPLTVRLGMQDSSLKIDEGELKDLLTELKKRDDVIGGWTLIYDVRSEPPQKHPTWRLAAEIRPNTIDGISWCTLDSGQRLLCLDVKGVGVFVGRQRKARRARSFKI